MSRVHQPYYYKDSEFQLELNLQDMRRQLVSFLEEIGATGCYVCNKLPCRCDNDQSGKTPTTLKGPGSNTADDIDLEIRVTDDKAPAEEIPTVSAELLHASSRLPDIPAVVKSGQSIGATSPHGSECRCLDKHQDIVAWVEASADVTPSPEVPDWSDILASQRLVCQVKPHRSLYVDTSLLVDGPVYGAGELTCPVKSFFRRFHLDTGHLASLPQPLPSASRYSYGYF